MSITPAPRVAVVLAAGALALAACSSSTAATSPVRDQNNDVPFNGCDQVECTGTLSGAAYEIAMPETWNGTLLIYSHGYRVPVPVPPSFSPVQTTAEPAPGWGSGQKEIGEALLSQGYAIAGSAYASNGWAVADGVSAGEQIYQFFSDKIAKPNRVYVWGDSLGGLITETIAQENPEWVDGAAPFCGALAGAVPNFELALDVAYSVQTLIDPTMKITGFSSYEDAIKNLTQASTALVKGAQAQDTQAIAAILLIADLVDAPAKTATYDGATVASQVSGTIEALVTALTFGTVGRYDMEQRYGGNVSGNEGTDYSARIDEAQKATIDTIGGAGTADALLAKLAAGTRVAADPAAQEKALSEGGNPSGAVKDPTITIHTADDPLVIVQNESFFYQRYAAQLEQGNVAGGLLQLYTTPPATYPESTGAPYGAGHCNFTPETRLAVVDMLNTWVRDGVYPGPEAVTAALPPDSTGYSSAYVPSEWPDPEAVITE